MIFFIGIFYSDCAEFLKTDVAIIENFIGLLVKEKIGRKPSYAKIELLDACEIFPTAVS